MKAAVGISACLGPMKNRIEISGGIEDASSQLILPASTSSRAYSHITESVGALVRPAMNYSEEDYDDDEETSASSKETQSRDVNIIETGDMMKVTQVLEDAIIDALEGDGYSLRLKFEYIKIGIMVLACSLALVAQFYPLPFPQNRVLLGICSIGYFVLSGIFQLYVTFVEKDQLCIIEVRFIVEV